MIEQLSFETVKSPAQIKRVSALAEEIWPEHYTGLIGAVQVRYMLDSVHSSAAIRQQIQDDMHYELLVTDKDCGYSAYKITAACCFISKLYVRHSCRGLGLGSRAMQRIISTAREHVCSRLELSVNRGNVDSIAFYQRHGWTIVKDTQIDIGAGFIMDDHLMRLDLAAKH